MKNTIYTIYLYVVAAVSLLFVAIALGTFINTTLKVIVFTKANIGFCQQMYDPMVMMPHYEGVKEDVPQPTKEERKEAYENCRVQAVQERYARSITMAVVAVPILLLHWALIKRARKNE